MATGGGGAGFQLFWTGAGFGGAFHVEVGVLVRLVGLVLGLDQFFGGLFGAEDRRANKSFLFGPAAWPFAAGLVTVGGVATAAVGLKDGYGFAFIHELTQIEVILPCWYG